MIKKMLDFILTPWRRYKQKKAWKKRLEELRRRDPFIYK